MSTSFRRVQGGGVATLWTFLSAAALRHRTIGSVWPSSTPLARLLASVISPAGHPVVVELGPGTGAVSMLIAQRLPAGSRHLAVEIDPSMAACLKGRSPGVDVINADATRLVAVLAARGVDHVDTVVSGLPWSLFSSATQQAILDQVLAVLPADGCFTTFAYRHATRMASARAFRERLDASFAAVTVSPTVWKNLPPAFTYICRRPVPVSKFATDREPNDTNSHASVSVGDDTSLTVVEQPVDDSGPGW